MSGQSPRGPAVAPPQISDTERDIRKAVVLTILQNYPGIPDDSNVKMIARASESLARHILGKAE